jgi:hypothetical protein
MATMTWVVVGLVVVGLLSGLREPLQLGGALFLLAMIFVTVILLQEARQRR